MHKHSYQRHDCRLLTVLLEHQLHFRILPVPKRTINWHVSPCSFWLQLHYWCNMRFWKLCGELLWFRSEWATVRDYFLMRHLFRVSYSEFPQQRLHDRRYLDPKHWKKYSLSSSSGSTVYAKVRNNIFVLCWILRINSLVLFSLYLLELCQPNMLL